MEQNRLYLPNLDVLRFLAALYVVMTHYGFIGPHWGMTGYSAPEGLISEFLRLGYIGVPVFFALSGFLIAHVSQNRDGVSFAINRVFRHLAFLNQPLLLAFVTTIAMIVLAYAIHELAETPLRNWL